jgi:beta-lactamase regulating signal transducer with metallopeptidase domain
MTPVIDTLVLALLNGLWFALAVAVAVWVALRITPQIGARARHAIWWVALVVVVFAPVVPVVAGWLAEEPAYTETATSVAPVPGDQEFERVTAPPVAIEQAPDPDRAAAPVLLDSTDWVGVAFAAWAALILLQLSRVFRSFRYLRSLKASARPASLEDQLRFQEWCMACRVDRPARLLLSNRIASPMAVGFFRPAVILPESLNGQLSEPELDHVLLHELAHVARRDDWTNLLARMAVAVFALHPVALWILRRIDREREIACDDWVVAATGAARPYAESLARLFELCSVRRRELLATGMVERASRLRERIEIILGRRRNKSRRASKLRVAITACGLTAIVIAAASAPPWVALAQDPPPAPAPVAPLAAPTPRPPARVAPRASVVSPRGTQTLPVQAAQPIQPVPPASAPSVIAAAQRGSLLAALVAAGYNDMSVDDIIELKNHGVNAAYITGLKDSGWAKLNAKQIVQLRSNNVPADYLGKLRAAGHSTLTIEDVIQLRNHGVAIEELATVNALGFGPFTPRQMLDLHNNGVRAPLYQALKDNGFVKAEPREIIEAQMHGLRAEHFREARAYGPSLTLKQIIKLKTAGVI